MMNVWSAKAKVSPAASSFEKPSCGEHGDPEAAQDEDHVDEQHAGGADQPELLRERGVDEVGVHVGDQVGAAGGRERAAAEAGAARSRRCAIEYGDWTSW